MRKKKNPKARRVDVLVLGAGSAGLNARHSAEKEGARALLIDPNPFGTTCAKFGCMPSKLLIAAADAAHESRRAFQFGVRTKVTVQGARVLARVQKERDRFVSFILPKLKALKQKGKLIEGTPAFLDTKTVSVNDEVIHAKAIVFATGAIPQIPREYQSLKCCLLTHENLFELKHLPKSVLIVGTGIIGLELGQALHRLGVRVTFLARNASIGPLRDPAILKRARKIFSEELDIRFQCRAKNIRETKSGVQVELHGRNQKIRREFYEKILIATGRAPQFDPAVLKHLGIPLDSRTPLKINPQTMRASKTHFYFAGDAAGFRPVLHEAVHEGKIAGVNAARFPRNQKMPRKTPLTIVFTEPQIALVGETHRDFAARKVLTGTADYSDQGRARIMGLNQGLIRVYGNARGRILGAEMLGPRMEHMAHLMAWAVGQQLTAVELLKMPFYHPVLEEGLRTALENLASQLK